MIYIYFRKKNKCNCCTIESNINYLVFTQISKNKRVYCLNCVNNKYHLKDLCRLQLENLSFFDYKIVTKETIYQSSDNIIDFLKDMKKLNITLQNNKVYNPIKSVKNNGNYYISLNLKNFEKNLNINDLNYLKKINILIINSNILSNKSIKLIALASVFDKNSFFYNIPIDITKLILSNVFKN